jgi:hypothetical protein
VGLGTYLQTLAAAITGQGQQQPAPQSQQISNLASAGFPGAQQMQQNPPTPQSGGGLTGFLGSPLTQAALQGYFSAAGSPRLAGLGGRISAGGLGALGGFNAAEANQTRQQQAQAALQGTQAKNQLYGAQTALAQGKAQQLAGIPVANADLAAQVHAAIPTMTPTQAQRAERYANAIANDAYTQHTWTEANNVIYQEPLKEGQIKAQTDAEVAASKKSEAETAAIPSEEALRQAETGRANAEATKAAAPPEDKNVADWYDPTTGQQYRGDQRKPTDKLVSSEPKDKAPDGLATLTKLRALYDKSGGSEYFASTRGVPSFEKFTAAHGIDPKSGGALPPIESGWHYDYDDASGMPIAVDPNGVPHRYEP